MFNWFKKTPLTEKVASGSDVDTIGDSVVHFPHPNLPPVGEGTNESLREFHVNESKAFKDQGNAHFGNGRLEDAAECFRRAIALNPRYAEACTNLGYVFQVQGNIEGAIALYRKAVTFDPDLLTAHQNLGFALMNLGQSDAAEESLHRVIALVPEHVGALQNLGVIAAQRGDLTRAETLLSRALVLQPDYAEAHYNFGSLLQQTKRLLEAEVSYRRALELQPHYAEAHNSLGNLLQQTKRLPEAEASYRRALELQPGYAEAHINLGTLLMEETRLPEAETAYLRALELKPDYTEVHSNLGNTLNALGRLVEAEASFRRALQIKPDFVGAHSNLGNTLKDMGRLDEAEASLRQALQIDPDFAEAHNNLGVTLNNLGRLDEADASFRRALHICPDCAGAHNNLGNTLKDQGRLDEAEASFRRALSTKPDFVAAYDNLLYLHAFTRNISPESECGLAANWENIALDESERTAAHNRADLFPRYPRAGRKLKIGVVSAEIGQHPVAEFLEPILEQLDRNRFHVTLFPTIERTEPRAARLKALADEFIPLVGISDDKAADLIRSDLIDILIDTTSHMRGCRLGIFARRAAPVQCHYIGYHGTTGLTEMDWFIADGELLPSGYDTHFCEGIWRLPRLRLSYKGDPSLPESRWTPGPDGTIWLGSFNNLTKVREEALGLWAKVMNAIPESRLLLKDRKAVSHAVQQRIKTGLARYGIGAGRVEFVGHVPGWSSHMALYDRLDIALDTIPLNSETTAFDALWMGVPLVALEGNWYGGRMASTILKALEKPGWIAQSEDEYVAIAAALARDVAGRKSLRAAQRTLMANSPLCDAKGLTRALEDAFEKMFDQWLGKCEHPQGIHD